MRIAQVAPLTEAVPPKLYGGTERVVHWLTEELVALGNDVTLFASGDSQTSAKLDATWPKALRLDGSVRDPNALHMMMLERVRQKCDDEEFDFLHFHLDYYPFSLFSRQPTPFLTTLHGRLDLPEHQPVFTTFSEDGLGSGSLLSASGDVLTNYHVVRGYSTVAVIFKPATEGTAPNREDVRVGQVLKFDEVADLALLRVANVPPGRSPVRLGTTDDISVGADVHAIGHPTGEAWTYTTGIISQYRMAYKWKNGGEDIQHIADVIQTQTPINAGNSGGPLLSDAGTLVGVNSFKAVKGEGLNFAVSVDDVKRFLLRSPGVAGAVSPAQSSAECKPKTLANYRSRDNTSAITSLDMFCNGKASGEYVVPDKQSAPILLRVDRNGDGKADLIFFDLKRSGKWEISWWDEAYTGQWSLVGYHDDGTLTPTRFESYADYQRRTFANKQ